MAVRPALRIVRPALRARLSSPYANGAQASAAAWIQKYMYSTAQGPFASPRLINSSDVVQVGNLA
jgi:hypothetical protein